MNINPNTKPLAKRFSHAWKWAGIAGVWVILFGLLYWYAPISALPIPHADYWNDKAIDVTILTAAVATVLLSIRLTRHFHPSEPPHRVWFTFTLGWCSWMGGELTGFIYDYYYWFTALPEFTVIDVFWLLGYLFFGLSLYYQFRLIYRHKQEQTVTFYFIFVATALLLTLGLTQLAIQAGLGEDYSWGALYLAVLYPVLDLAEGAAALWLFFLFGRGYLGRPWWGLIAFAIADGINIFFWMGGYKWLSDQTYYLLDLFSNVVYISSYLITALAFFAAHDRIEGGVLLAANTH